MGTVTEITTAPSIRKSIMVAQQDIEKLYADMIGQLESIHEPIKGSSVENLGDRLACTLKTLVSLREIVRREPFNNDEDEIHFYKYIKPRFQCWHIYVIELHHLVTGVPVGTDKMIRNYYLEEFKAIDRFLKRYAFAYQYYLNNEMAKDDLFFLCRNRSPFPPEQEHATEGPGFGTTMDYLFAKFRSCEMLKDFIIRQVRLLYQKVDGTLLSELKAANRRWWSGDKVDLIEIAYGIYYTQRINGGKAEISDIVEWLEESLNVDLGQAYRMFLDIRRRKRVSFTKYLDEMRTAIHSQIEESLNYRSKKPHPKS